MINSNFGEFIISFSWVVFLLLFKLVLGTFEANRGSKLLLHLGNLSAVRRTLKILCEIIFPNNK